MYQKRGIAFRRHQYARLKAKRFKENYWGKSKDSDWGWCPASLGIAVNTPKPCSCHMCANARGLEGESLAERRNALAYQDFE